MWAQTPQERVSAVRKTSRTVRSYFISKPQKFGHGNKKLVQWRPALASCVSLQTHQAFVSHAEGVAEADVDGQHQEKDDDDRLPPTH